MIGRERDGWPCNAVMYMPPEHPIAVGVLENYRRKGLAEWTYIKPRARKLLFDLIGREYGIADLPNGHWGRHALQHYVRKLKLWDKLQPQDRFFAEETYTGVLLEPGDHSRISENPEVCGVHFFEKKKQNQAPAPGSFYAWARERVAAQL